MMTLEDLCDLEDIRALTVDYGYYFDTRQAEAFTALFCEDAVYDQRRIGLDVVSHGWEEIGAVYRAAIGQTEGTVHYCTNQRVTRLAEDEAEGFCYFQAKSLLTNGHRTEFLGHYEDRYRRVDGKWRFAARALVAHIIPAAEGFVPGVDARPTGIAD